MKNLFILATDATDLCSKGNVRSVFRAIGWIITFAKIIVPLIIIIFALISFGKAMVAGKDDEIKKAGKTLVTNSLIGMLIFFIPTLLGFVVTLIGGDNLYNGTFGECTNCILSPNECEVIFEEPKDPTIPNSSGPSYMPNNPGSSFETENNESGNSGNSSSGGNATTPQGPSNGKASTQWKQSNGMNYIETVPDGDKSGLPLVIFLHGRGEMNKAKSQVEALAPIQFVESGNAYKSGNFVFIAPAGQGDWISYYTSLKNIIETTVQTYNLNRNKIILTGFSMGGAGVWSIINSDPNYYSAAVAVSAVHTVDSPAVYANTPLKAIAGTAEGNGELEVTYSNDMKAFVNRINEAGGDAEFYNVGTTHANVQSSFFTNDLLTWALSKTRK